MITIVHKTSSVGCSWIGRPVFSDEFQLQIGHFLFCLQKPLVNGYFLLVSRISLVQERKLLFSKKEESVNIPVVGKRLSDIIDLNAFVLLSGIRKEKNSVKCIPFGRKIDKFSFWTFPDAMKFSLNKNFGPLPNGPANVLFAAMKGNMLWNNSETFVRWFAKQRPRWDKNGSMLGNLVTK